RVPGPPRTGGTAGRPTAGSADPVTRRTIRATDEPPGPASGASLAGPAAAIRDQQVRAGPGDKTSRRTHGSPGARAAPGRMPPGTVRNNVPATRPAVSREPAGRTRRPSRTMTHKASRYTTRSRAAAEAASAGRAAPMRPEPRGR